MYLKILFAISLLYFTHINALRAMYKDDGNEPEKKAISPTPVLHLSEDEHMKTNHYFPVASIYFLHEEAKRMWRSLPRDKWHLLFTTHEQDEKSISYLNAFYIVPWSQHESFFLDIQRATHNAVVNVLKEFEKSGDSIYTIWPDYLLRQGTRRIVGVMICETLGDSWQKSLLVEVCFYLDDLGLQRVDESRIAKGLWLIRHLNEKLYKNIEDLRKSVSSQNAAEALSS